jgi:hypothetical protein
MAERRVSQFAQINAEIDEIDAAVAQLLHRKQHLVGLRTKIWAEQCLRPEDRVTEKNAKKFDVLGRVHWALYTREEGKPHGVRGLDLFSQIERGDLNYQTFRSYLHRFKEEGRLAYDNRNGRWRLPPRKEQPAENN